MVFWLLLNFHELIWISFHCDIIYQSTMRIGGYLLQA
jgi:hypothetical protein